MKKTVKNKYILPVIVIIIIILLWETGIRISGTPMYILPAPSDIAGAFAGDFDRLMAESAVTMSETLLGMVIAVFLGILGALFMDKFNLLKNAIYPLLVISQAIPVIVLAPLFIIYLGFGMAPKILTVILMCFFPVIVTYTDGMSRVDNRLVDLARSYGANSLQVYYMIKMPAASGALFSGMKIAATYSVTGAVVGEWLSSDSGLGYYMLITKNGYMLDKMFASILIVVILSLMMNGLVRAIKHLVMPDFKSNNSTNKRRNQF